jgi:hypothetical protein
MSTVPATGSSRTPPSRLIKLSAPVTTRLAGRRWFPLWAQLRHKGRRSGKEYVIPVAVMVVVKEHHLSHILHAFL